MHQLRQYQQEITDKAIQYLRRSSKPAVIDACVAAGKTLIIATIAKHVLSKGGRVISLAHQMELIQGAIDTYEDDCGVCAASLGRKEFKHQMTFASEQTLKNNLHKFKAIDLLIVDECHRINCHNKNTSYMKIINYFLKINPKLRIIGLTGTPFRLQSGKTSLIVGKQLLFKSFIDKIFIKDLLKLNYVTTPITPHAIEAQSYDFSDIKMKMGKYQEKELNEVTSNERLTKTIIKEVIKLCSNRNKVLIFASTLQHATEIQGYLKEYNQTCGYLDGKLKKADRELELKLFNTGQHKFLVNKDLLSTGYDEPAIDAIIMLRPSESRALIIQCIGRSLRLHESKKDALILDYAENFDSLSDLLENENIKSISPREKGAQETIICPECGTLCGEHDHKCKTCGFYFVSKTCEACETQQSISNRYCISCEAELIDPNIPLTISPSGREFFVAKVINTSLSSHTKNKKCLRLDYLVDDKLNNYPNVSQFIAERSGLLKHWLKKHYIKTQDPVMDEMMIDTYTDSVDRVLQAKDRFKMPEIIKYKKIGKYFNVI